jgi:hypothetical protein
MARDYPAVTSVTRRTDSDPELALNAAMATATGEPMSAHGGFASITPLS